MGTKIQANPFLRQYHSVIDLDDTSNAMRSSYNENGMLQNGKNPASILSYDIEKVKQTILEHESIFRNQLGELHRLYGKQRELMNEIKRRGISKDDVMEEKFQLSYLLSPFPTDNAKRSWSSSSNNIFHGGTYNLGFPADWCSSNMEKRIQERFSKFPIAESTSEKRNHAAAFDGDDKFSVRAVQTSQHGTDALTFSLYNRNSYPGHISMANPTNGVPNRLALSRAEISANSRSTINLVTKDFFHDTLDRKNEEVSLTDRELRNERSGKEHVSDDYAVNSPEKRRFDEHSSLGDLCSGKPLVSPQSLLAEPRKEFSNSTSLSRKKKKIFGVEISEGNDDAFDSFPNMSCNLDRRDGSSLVADSFVQNLSFHGANRNDGNNERSKADLKGEISSQNRLSFHSGMNGKWLDSDSKIDCKNVDNANMAAEAPKKDPEHSQKLREMIPQHHMLADCNRNQENSKGSSLPWFLRDSQVSTDLNNGTKSSYFMNLDSLQSCSHKFFAKVEMPDGALQASKHKKEVKGRDSGAGDDFARRIEIDESAPRIHLGTKDLVLDKGLNNCISDLRHCIDLNLSLDEEDAPSAPSLPSAIVKIATTEIDLEASAGFESEVDASPKELDSRESDVSQVNSGSSYEECDKLAAEAMIAISSPLEEKMDDDDDSFTSLKWFVEVVSSEHGAAAGVAVDVSMNQRRACEEEEEESIPDGMDYFEFMTLKLEDSKEKHHHCEPFVLKASSDDENGTALTRRTRRGQSRRGRQRKDFQRDILPGLVTLSRLQVAEDFQAFEELLRAGGATWQSGLSHRGSGRNRRGRKRLATSPTVKTPCSTQAEQPVCQIEERSLAGWGKKTRRLPRQRCPNAFLSFPVKC